MAGEPVQLEAALQLLAHSAGQHHDDGEDRGEAGSRISAPIGLAGTLCRAGTTARSAATTSEMPSSTAGASATPRGRLAPDRPAGDEHGGHRFAVAAHEPHDQRRDQGGVAERDADHERGIERAIGLEAVHAGGREHAGDDQLCRDSSSRAALRDGTGAASCAAAPVRAVGERARPAPRACRAPSPSSKRVVGRWYTFPVSDAARAAIAAQRVLIVEDDEAARLGLTELVRTWGFTVEAAADGEQAMAAVTSFRPTIIVSDLVMPRMDGLQLLAALGDDLAHIYFVLLTAQGTVETAVDALKHGAEDYLTKPVDPQRLRHLLERLAELSAARRENTDLRRRLREEGRFGRMVGASREMRKVYNVIEQAAPTTASVLIIGESGTGKELVAQTLHQLSPRAQAPVCGDQLRGHSRDAARERDLRPREGRLHRRLRAPRRLLRAGRSRHAVPRRDRRDDAGHAGEAAARAAGAPLPAAGRPRRAGRRRAGHRRHQRRSGRRPCAPASSARTSTTG